ncbi:DUF5994 family protein [Nonomuraea zeae]|uniref:Uncharacterized protein n=1 Tax=Nonomuraea zeae TaxID=1642303 RepID=A0A5S4G635_9ACTN|nr:DUF5994 family protein [Nonomuraea zeae]TMR28485.1 hypothetical protein ETD85_35740 [Nonomuraea zeae]
MPIHDSPPAPIALRPARVFLEPTLARDGTLDGAWWPRTTDLHRELPALVTILEDRLGPILRVKLNLAAWDDTPAHLLVGGRFLRVSGFTGTANTIRVIRGDKDGYLLLVVPPDTEAPAATAAMRTAASTGNTLSASEILAHCGRAAPGPAPSMRMRPYRPADQQAVLALIEADSLPGQPACSPAALDQAVAGTPRSEPVLWSDLERPRTDVLVDPEGHIMGVISYAAHQTEDSGEILWLHGQEIPDIVEALVAHALLELSGGAAVHAFTAARGLGLPALPTGRRPVTRKVLEHAGFTGRNSWHYLRRTKPCAPGATACPPVEVVDSQTPPGWWLKARDDDSAAEVVAQEPQSGLGVLWWFSAAPHHADQALERALLQQADLLLREHGAMETILYAADDPASRQPGAWGLLEDAGFTEIDHLVSYTRRAVPGDNPIQALG